MAQPPAGFTVNNPTPPPGFSVISQPETEDQRLNFAQRFGERLFERQKMAEEIMRATNEGEQTTAEGMLQVVGKVGFGSVLDFLGEGLVSAGRGVSAITPDFIEERAIDSATRTGQMLLNTTAGQAGLAAAQEGAPAYEEFAENNPRAARNIEAVVDIGLVTAPPLRASRVGRIRTSQERFLQRAGESLTQGGEAQALNVRNSFIDDLIRPKQTAKVRAEQTARTTEEGLLRSKVVEPSAAEQVIAAEVRTIPGVAENKTLQGNLNVIREELGAEAEILLAELRQSPARISHTEVEKSLDLVRRNLESIPTVTGDAAKTSNKLIDAALGFVRKNPQTSAGLLKARQQFDSFLTGQKRNALGDVPLENALTLASRDVRQAMNNLIQIKNPSTGVRTSLARQSNMFRAMDNIAPKAADEAANVIHRAWQNALKILPFRGEFNQMMAAGFGIGGLGASALFAPAFTKILGFGGLAYFSGKAITSPAAKKALGALIKKTDDAIAVATNPEMLTQLRLDRGLLVQLTESE